MLNNTGDNDRLLTGNDDNKNSNTDTDSCNVANELPQKPSIEERFVSKMALYSRETIGLFIGIAFTLAFATLHSTPAKISKPPLPRPFFNENSVIIDFYRGQVSAMIERASDSDLSFIMYYAPWDAESQIVRHEFEIVAQYYHSKVFFAAINCWHPGSECRAEYPKIQSYPVLIMYPLRGFGLQYKGIPTAPYMMHFIESYLTPLTRISSRRELGELLIHNENVFLGFFNFSSLPVSPGYQEFYRASIKALEKDPNQEVKFAVVTNSAMASEEFIVTQFPSASLFLWNESLIYPVDKPWTTDNLLHWMHDSVHRVSSWLQPPGIKSLTLTPYLRAKPVLILFTPRNPFHPSNYNYKLLQEIALEYYNCNHVWWTNSLIEYLKNERQHSESVHQDTSRKCSQFISKSSDSSTPLGISIEQWINDSCCHKIFMNKCLLCKDNGESVCNIPQDHLHKFCSRKDIFQVVNEKEDIDRNFCCNDSPYDHSKKFTSSMITGENDVLSAENLQKQFVRDNCELFMLGNKYHYPIFPGDSDNMKLSTSACANNKSLTFIAIDSLHYFHFAEALGIDLMKSENKTAVVILDASQESQYLMPEELSRNSLISFINNFVNGTIKRQLRSDSTRRFATDFQPIAECAGKKVNEICIPELTTETFLSTVMNPSKDVVVLYHSPYCAFCGAVAYVYLTVAQYLKRMTNILFVRIDGDNNDLPWEYSMNRYPSVLFFPAKRKEDSTVYPFSLPITIPNLLNFVLANLDDDSHIEALVNVCHTGAGEPPKDCVARIRRLCLDIIHNQLRIYRKLRRERKYLPKPAVLTKKRRILRRLEHIREIHLILSAVEDLTYDKKYFAIGKKFHKYYKNLEKIGKKICIISNEQQSINDKKIVKIGKSKDEL